MAGGSFSTRGSQRGRKSGTTLRSLSALTVFGALLLCPGTAPGDDVFTYRAPNGVQHFTNVPTTKKFKAFAPPSQRLTLLSLKREAPKPAWTKLRVGREMREMIATTAYRFDLEPALMHAVVRAESGFNPQAVSRAGARGLMQLMPATALEVGVRDVFHPQDNLNGGASYLRGLIDRYSGDVHLALAAYNAGPGAVESHGGVPPYAETQEYLRRVFRFRQEYLHDALREPGGIRR
ncbi:MAG: lytic transglycosylase domain-containing protein [Candidatus Binatia bacterium]|nr:lytic transglycosylase domain-containing protein [Candidatus Binatia bacterium]